MLENFFWLFSVNWLYLPKTSVTHCHSSYYTLCKPCRCCQSNVFCLLSTHSFHWLLYFDWNAIIVQNITFWRATFLAVIAMAIERSSKLAFASIATLSFPILWCCLNLCVYVVYVNNYSYIISMDSTNHFVYMCAK